MISSFVDECYRTGGETLKRVYRLLIIFVIISVAIGLAAGLLVSKPTQPSKPTILPKETNLVCAVYFTYIGCPNCAVTDPIVLINWINKNDKLVIIEYGWHKGEWGHPNAKVAGEYAEKYHSQAAVPQVILDERHLWLGRVDVPKAEPYISKLKSNPCPLISGAAAFEAINLKDLPGLPKIWANGRVLISLGNGSWIVGWNGSEAKLEDSGSKSMDIDYLKSLLFVEDVAKSLKGYRYKPIGAIMVPFSGSAFPKDMGFVPGAVFKNAVRVTPSDPPPSSNPNVSSQQEANIIPEFSQESEINLAWLTIVIAGMDSLNPCAFYILTFLLSILIYARDRRKILIVGGIFTFFSGLCYFLFMAAWLNVFLIGSHIQPLIWAIMAFVIIAGAMNIKDYFKPEKGPSLSSSSKKLAEIGRAVRKLIGVESILSLAVGASILAFMVNLYELLCTAGFPVVYTKILTSFNLDPLTYYLYLVFYNVIYVLPLVGIVLLFAFTLGRMRLSETWARRLKLFSGYLMIALALSLLIDPMILETFQSTVSLLIASVTASAVTITGYEYLIKHRKRAHLSIQKS